MVTHSGQSLATTNAAPLNQNSKSPAVVNAQLKQDFIPIASNNPVVTANTLARNTINGTNIEATGARPRKPCNCTKSQCLKLYCDCFANGEFCHNCNCTNCANNLEHEEERSRAIKACLDRNPLAFHPKIGKGKGKDGDGDRRHNKGCNCKRSGCLKNYCECYEAKIMCSSICKCVGCKNFEESMERKTLMHLADAAEVRVQQQSVSRTTLLVAIVVVVCLTHGLSCCRLPYTFVTSDVVGETCVCLMARAEESEKLKLPSVVQERMVIEEFGRCLMRIIDSAHKTKGNEIYQG
ncbi:protein lin-54 homolog [Octopus bimaculoides]|uniref:protein lin-54 homolog n=1 Tax=Octopus bimaculoides TaxID=37653 RepID=UPI00071E2AD1|nr:protein lin-54 homolog [Octopus bimaculoides]|eukprot:XP_014785140.1 PREDICTED: protein lin-54 homolog [Octopus bimaculoides]